MAGKHDKIKDSDRTSIITPILNKCYICGSTDRVALHEIYFGTSNRKKSKEDQMIVPLCGPHHNLSSLGVHFNHDLDLHLKMLGEKVWIKTYCDDEDSEKEKINKFIKRFGRNYLEDDML